LAFLAFALPSGMVSKSAIDIAFAVAS